MLQLLGVNRVAIYKTSNSPEIQRILDYYTHKGGVWWSWFFACDCVVSPHSNCSRSFSVLALSTSLCKQCEQSSQTSFSRRSWRKFLVAWDQSTVAGSYPWKWPLLRLYLFLDHLFFTFSSLKTLLPISALLGSACKPWQHNTIPSPFYTHIYICVYNGFIRACENSCRLLVETLRLSRTVNALKTKTSS